jgi:ribosomal protein S18 acetylase RimI-like enzyme
MTAAVDEWCGRNRIACLYLLVDSTDTASMRVAEDHGFHMVDIRVTLDTDLTHAERFLKQPDGMEIRECTENDIGPLKEMARTNHVISRFFTDGGFRRERCEELYSLWIEKCFREFGDTVFVALLDGVTAGYIACRLDSGRHGQIILAGVGDTARNRGIGTHLVSAATSWFRQNGAAGAMVVTQGMNIQAMRLYTSMGFYPRSVQLWYHRWQRSEAATVS